MNIFPFELLEYEYTEHDVLTLFILIFIAIRSDDNENAKDLKRMEKQALNIYVN